jgi:hypothetical protein
MPYAIYCPKREPKYSDDSSSEMHKLHGGGTNRVSRRICVISVALRDLPAVIKCHFSGMSRVIRRPFSGKCAIYATNAITTAIITTFVPIALQTSYP